MNWDHWNGVPFGDGHPRPGSPRNGGKPPLAPWMVLVSIVIIGIIVLTCIW